MNIHTQQHGFDVYTIASPDGKTRASFVPEKGGVGSSLIMPWHGQERELLYRHDHFWERGNPHLPGGWPFIFPICARIARNGIFGNYLYDGELYNLPIHGFAANSAWKIGHATPQNDRLTLVLEETPATLKCYPFRFRLEFEYVVENKKFICYQKFINTGAKPLPYYGGFHPYFLIPSLAQKEQVMLNYQAVRHFRYNDELTDLVGTQPLLSMPMAVANPLLNEQLVELGEDKNITLTYPDGFKINWLVIGAKDPNMFRFVQTYTQTTEPFICVEPWMGVPNALNSVAGVRWLNPGESELGISQLWV